MNNYVYVLECPDTKLVKIGITSKPVGRFRHLCNASGRNFAKWMRAERDTQPPACMVTLMNILERSSEARRIMGIEE